MRPDRADDRSLRRSARRRPARRVAASATVAAMVAALVAAGCGSDDDGATGDSSVPAAGDSSVPATAAGGGSVTLVTYDSFPEGDTSLNDALAAFSAETGIDVDILVAGDTGTMLAKAALTAGNPEGDVMWGIDNTYLSRAVAEGIFEPYVAAPIADGSVTVDEAFTALVPDGAATPVDYGDVCVNVDIGWFDERSLAPPETFADLADPAHAGLLVVENPATSSPGLAFLLATIDEYGVDGWQKYWQELAANDVAVVDDWTQAYYEQFSWAGGDRPLVVSYGSSPPAEVIFADPPRDDAPTGVVEATCFRQVEFAGILRGTDDLEGAQALVDFLVGHTFQSELPLNLFVYPVNTAVELPTEFVEFAVVPADPRTLDPALIEENRSAWIDEWTALVLG